jgi:hypothetical protein
MNTNNNESPFGEVICAYARVQAVADGLTLYLCAKKCVVNCAVKN